MPQYRFGIIGFGGVGKAYAGALDAAEGADVVATSGPNGAGGRYLHFENGDGVLSRQDINAVVLACPTVQIRAYAEAALAHGWHVLCAGPPGASLADAETIRSTASQSAGTLRFATPLGFHGSILKAQDILETASLGGVLTIRMVYGQAGPSVTPEEDWIGDAALAGDGALLTAGFPLIDLVQQLAGDIVEAYGIASQRLGPPGGMDDNAFALVRCAGGVVAQIHASRTQWRNTFRMEIGLERGYLWLEGLASEDGAYAPEMLISARVKTDEFDHALANPPEEVRSFDEGRDAIDRTVAAFLRTLNGVPGGLERDAQSALDTMAIIQRIYDGGQS